MKYRLIIFTLVSLLTTQSFAYLAIGESGEVRPQGHYLIGFEPQILLNEGGGANVGGFLDRAWRDDLSSRFSLGVGKIDFHLGTSLKYIPFPDVDKQPAIGVKTAFWFARQGDKNVWTLQLAPLFSKKFDMEFGAMIPYAAIPVNFVNSTDRNYTGTQFTIGTELKHNDYSRMIFSAEAVLSLKDSYSFVSGTVSFPFDSDKGLSGSK